MLPYRYHFYDNFILHISISHHIAPISEGPFQRPSWPRAFQPRALLINQTEYFPPSKTLLLIMITVIFGWTNARAIPRAPRRIMAVLTWAKIPDQTQAQLLQSESKHTHTLNVNTKWDLTASRAARLMGHVLFFLLRLEWAGNTGLIVRQKCDVIIS